MITTPIHTVLETNKEYVIYADAVKNATQHVLEAWNITKTWRQSLDGETWNEKIASYVDQCLAHWEVKALHQQPYGRLRPLAILEWKSDHIARDFVTELPRSKREETAL